MNFQNKDLVSFLSARGLRATTEPGGRIFPASRNAGDVLQILIKECARRGAEIKCVEAVLEVLRKERHFILQTKKDNFTAENVVIATGGITYPQTGSTGDGFTFAKSLGHRVTGLSPALTSVTIKDYPFSPLSGISFSESLIVLTRNGKKAAQITGDLLFTHTGLSGPAILDLSRHIRRGDTLMASFLPGLDKQKAEEIFIERISESGTRQVRKTLQAFNLPERFVKKFLDMAGIDQELTGAHLSRESRSALLSLLTGYPFVVSRLGGLDEAMVTRGGVALEEINPKTMESKLLPGLFFIGEVLDIDGDTGGYNLQAAFSTAAICARKIRRG